MEWEDLSEAGKESCIKRWRRESTYAHYPLHILEKILGREIIDDMLIKQHTKFCTTGAYSIFDNKPILVIQDIWE